MFQDVLERPDRAALETPTGEWMDPRWLARKALAMLDDGRLSSAERMAAR